MTGLLKESKFWPRKANVGCGYDIREGYVNIDNESYHNPDLVADITNLSMLPSGSFDEVVAQDVLEHIDRTKQVATLQEWGRLLAPAGILKVRVPSLTDMLALGLRSDWQNDERQQYLVQMVYGTQAYPGDYHRCGYTPHTISTNAEAAALLISRAELKDEWLYDLTFRRKEEEQDLSEEEFVHNAYFSFEHRLIDAGGLRYWSDQIQKGQDRNQVRVSIAAHCASERRPALK